MTRQVERIGRFLRVEGPLERTGCKTVRWILIAEDESHLGRIQWYGPWRQYVLEPLASAIFHAGCLRDVAAFLDRANAQHRAKRRVR